MQTTKFFAPETVTLLQNRISLGQPAGFQVGDIISYIVQFSPVANGANTGVAGYITDYLPSGVEVVDAAIVASNGAGGFVNVAPAFPGGIDSGWGDRGQNKFIGPFNTPGYDVTGRCSAGGALTNAAGPGNCNGRITELHADTGIFYSTDPRTAQFPPLPTRILQGVNGYNINPTAAGQLNPIIGQTNATTHNLWDADQTNAFGSAVAAVASLVAPKSAATVLISAGKIGQGPVPYRAGSPVAGPQSGYNLDNTGLVGPWQRIAYGGSRIGDPAGTGPALAPESSNTAVGGLFTSLGYNLSTSNPLPSGTNAVRWAVGKLVVGQISYVKISVRITQPVPSQGIINSSEVFGGDAGDAGNGKDNPWRYHVPSVADNNSNLYILKTPCTYDPTATTCVPLAGTYVAGNTTITYQITYINTGNSDQTNVVISDLAPCQTPLASQVLVGTVTGPLAPLVSVPFTTNTAIAGNCTTSPQTRATVTFPTIALLSAGNGGRFVINVKNNATALNDDVINSAIISSTQVSPGARSNAVTFVGTNASPALSLAKTVNTATAVAGGVITYSIVVKNVGTGTATNVVVSDVLPSTGGVADPTTRFNFVTPTVSIVQSGLVTNTALITSTNTAALFTPALTPYNTQPNAANSVVANWNFGTASTLAPGGVITITFSATVGTNVPASATPFGNNVVATYVNSAGAAFRADAVNAAPVTVVSNLTVTKTMECYYIGASCIPINESGTIPSGAKVRYAVNYANTGAPVSNVIITDILPCQLTSVAGSPTVSITATAGPIPAASSPVAVANGVCSTTFRTITLGSIASLASGATGSFSVEMQLVTPSTVTSVVTNQANISGTGAAGSSQVQNTVINVPNLIISKTASPESAKPGDTVSYVLTITNNGTAPATTITVFDWLPTGTSTVADTTRRFSFTGAAVFTGSLTSVPTTVNLPPTQSPYTLAAGNTFAPNQQELSWGFGAQTLVVGASTSIAFTAVIGSALQPLPPPNYYNNNAKVAYNTTLQSASNAAATSIINLVNLSITKTNSTSTLESGSTTTYTIVVSNGNLLAAGGAIIKDTPSAGLSCTRVTCSATTNGAQCPTNLPLNTVVIPPATTLLSTGETIEIFPPNSSITFLVTCGVLATGQ